MEFFKELRLNQPSTVIGVGTATLVLLGIYIFLLSTCKKQAFLLFVQQ